MTGPVIVFQLAGGDILVLPADARYETISRMPFIQGGAATSEVDRLRALAARLDYAIRSIEQMEKTK